MTEEKQTFFDCFDRVFIINLPERIDRRKAIQSELAWLGTSDISKVEIFPAVKPNERGGFPSIGARGCFMSHLEILRRARDSGLQRILILEDDLMFKNSLKKYQQTIMGHVAGETYDIVYLGHMLESKDIGTMKFEKYEQALMQSHFIAFRGTVIEKLVGFFEAVLQRPPGHPDGGPMHVDGAYTTFRMQNPTFITQIALPNLGFQRPSASDIAGYRWFDKVAGIRNLAAAARHIRSIRMRKP